MAFQDIIKVEKSDVYLDRAFSTAKKNASLAASKKKWKFKPEVEKQRAKELERIDTIKRVLVKALDRIIDSFPRVDDITEFYRELMKAQFDVDIMRKYLSNMNWARRKVEELSEVYKGKFKKALEPGRFSRYRDEYYGRISSVMKQAGKSMTYLEECRRLMREFPSIKSIPTVCLFGFPNVGKTTLLNKLTGSKPDIKEYAFTTKSLNIGYFIVNNMKIQVIDTPGTLDRFDKMNKYEKQAYLALKHVSDLIIYVFDLTEPFPLNDQKKLYKGLKTLKKPILVYISKADILGEEIIKDFLSKTNDKSIKNAFKSPENLKKEVIKLLKAQN